MTLNVYKRSEKGAPLTAVEHDANFTAIETEVNAHCIRLLTLDATGSTDCSAAVQAACTAANGWQGPYTRHIVTDANATTFHSIVAGGGANVVPVFSDGTNWRIG